MMALATPFFGRLLDTRGVRGPLLRLDRPLRGNNGRDRLRAILGVRSLRRLCAHGLSRCRGQNPGAYSKAISAWFDRSRGLALGIALAGVGIGTAVIPLLSNALISNFGWRHGYMGLGIIIFLLAFIPVLLFVREPAEVDTGGPSASVLVPAAGPGRDALRRAA